MDRVYHNLFSTTTQTRLGGLQLAGELAWKYHAWNYLKILYTVIYVVYSQVTIRKPRGPLRINEEQSFLEWTDPHHLTIKSVISSDRSNWFDRYQEDGPHNMSPTPDKTTTCVFSLISSGSWYSASRTFGQFSISNLTSLNVNLCLRI